MLNRKGFTLIELLIVVVIIGILAAIAIPKFANTKEKAYVASMKSDLRNMVNAQEAYFADFTQYTSSFATTQYSSSPGVTVAPALSGSQAGTGWSASATHNATNTTCVIFIGDGAPGIATNEGEPTCQ
jgi:prepilin-type N-terminal cleavage/methylation domain-containing protein